MTWNILLFLFLFPLGRPLARLHLPVNERSRMRMPNLWRGRWRDLSRQRLSRLCLAKATWRGTKSPPGDFGPARFRGAAARHRPTSSLVFVVRTSRLSHHVGHKERFGGHCESQCDAFQCKYLSPWGHGVIVAISCFSEIQPARLTSSLLRSCLCSPVLSYLIPPRPRYLITHPRVLRSALIFHCWSGRNNRIVSGS